MEGHVRSGCPILEAQHLKKSYRDRGRDVVAVRDVSLTLASGEILAFLGPNGAGKTTSIKMIAGLVRPDAGWVRIWDCDPHRQPATLKLLGAVLEGNRNVYWRYTPEENLEYFGVLRGMSRQAARQRGAELLEQFQLAHKRKALVQSLSRGMQQKLAIAVALMHQPPLLLLDEPTLGLDVEATEDVKHLIRTIVHQGCAILLTTHQLAIAEELANRVAIINNGEIVTEETTDELIRQFSGSAYLVETEHAISDDRVGKLHLLGMHLPTERSVHVADVHLLYQVLDILNPMPILQIQKDQANLTDVFLNLVRGESA